MMQSSRTVSKWLRSRAGGTVTSTLLLSGCCSEIVEPVSTRQIFPCIRFLTCGNTLLNIRIQFLIVGFAAAAGHRDQCKRKAITCRTSSISVLCVTISVNLGCIGGIWLPMLQGRWHWTRFDSCLRAATNVHLSRTYMWRSWPILADSMFIAHVVFYHTTFWHCNYDVMIFHVGIFRTNNF